MHILRRLDSLDLLPFVWTIISGEQHLESIIDDSILEWTNERIGGRMKCPLIKGAKEGPKGNQTSIDNINKELDPKHVHKLRTIIGDSLNLNQTKTNPTTRPDQIQQEKNEESISSYAPTVSNQNLLVSDKHKTVDQNCICFQFEQTLSSVLAVEPLARRMAEFEFSIPNSEKIGPELKWNTEGDSEKILNRNQIPLSIEC